MSTQDANDVEDIGEAVRADRALRKAAHYRIQLATDGLDFQPVLVADPVPLGSQILAAGGLDGRHGYSLFALLPSGDFEDVRLDEPFDLRDKGAEQFIAFRTDRDFKMTLNDSQLEWGRGFVRGNELYRLAKPKENEAVFLEVPGGQDKLIELSDLVPLDGSGIERFITAPRSKPVFVITVNSRERTVHDAHVTFEQVVSLAFPGPHEPNVTFTMSYRNAASRPHAGNLAEGGFVTVKQEGTVFNVTPTIRS